MKFFTNPVVFRETPRKYSMYYVTFEPWFCLPCQWWVKKFRLLEKPRVNRFRSCAQLLELLGGYLVVETATWILEPLELWHLLQHSHRFNMERADNEGCAMIDHRNVNHTWSIFFRFVTLQRSKFASPSKSWKASFIPMPSTVMVAVSSVESEGGDCSESGCWYSSWNCFHAMVQRSSSMHWIFWAPFFKGIGTGLLSFTGLSRNHAYMRVHLLASKWRLSTGTMWFFRLTVENGKSSFALSEVSYGSHSLFSLRRAIKAQPVIWTVPCTRPSRMSPTVPLKSHGLFPELQGLMGLTFYVVR